MLRCFTYRTSMMMSSIPFRFRFPVGKRRESIDLSSLGSSLNHSLYMYLFLVNEVICSGFEFLKTNHNYYVLHFERSLDSAFDHSVSVFFRVRAETIVELPPPAPRSCFAAKERINFDQYIQRTNLKKNVPVLPPSYHSIFSLFRIDSFQKKIFFTETLDENVSSELSSSSHFPFPPAAIHTHHLGEKRERGRERLDSEIFFVEIHQDLKIEHIFT